MDIKVIWPGTPRLVDAAKILGCATDALVNEEDSNPETTNVVDLGQAIDIVNKHGYLTTESYTDAAARELCDAQEEFATTAKAYMGTDVLAAIRSCDKAAASEIEKALVRWTNAGAALRTAQTHDAQKGG